MRLLTEGGEFGDMLGWTGFNGTELNTQYVRSGSYSFKLTYSGWNMYKTFTSSTEVYLRFGLYCIENTFQWTNNVICHLFDSAWTTEQTTISIASSTRKMQVWRGSAAATLLITSDINIANSTWYLIELYYKLHDSTGVAQLKIDGVSQGSIYNGDTKPATPADLGILNFDQNGNGERWIDDIALNNVDNSDGKGDISWCGDGHLQLLRPNGNSPDTWADQWIGSDGNSVDNYALVDEIPPSSSDYVQSETIGHQDRYAITNFAGTGKRIKRVWTEARALDASASGSKMKLGLRVSDTDYLSASKTLTASYAQVLGDHYVVNPNTSAEWSNGELDAAQSLVEVST